MTRRILALAALVAVWQLTLASEDAVDLVVGAVLAGAVLVALPGSATGAGPSPLARLVATPALAAVVLVDITRGTWDVALRVLGLRPLDRPGLVLIPIGDRTDVGIAATGLLFGLSPGSLMIEVDRARAAMVWHVIDARDPDAVRAHFERVYDRYQRRVIP